MLRSERVKTDIVINSGRIVENIWRVAEEEFRSGLGGENVWSRAALKCCK